MKPLDSFIFVCFSQGDSELFKWADAEKELYLLKNDKPDEHEDQITGKLRAVTMQRLTHSIARVSLSPALSTPSLKYGTLKKSSFAKLRYLLP